MKKAIHLLRGGHELLIARGAALQSPFLLGLRLYFFWQLFLTGQGKLANIGKVSEFFASLGIPLPTLNAYFIGSLECFGGLLLMIGLASRPLALLVLLSMSVAYVTADFGACRPCSPILTSLLKPTRSRFYPLPSLSLY